MHQLIELHPKAHALDVLGLPAIPYPVALPVFQAAVANDGELPLADMLRGLQVRASATTTWERLEPAMAQLAELLAPDDARDTAIARGDDWSLEIGPVDPDGELIAVQRGESLLAAIADRGDGRLRVAAWRPLDALTIGLLVELGAMPGNWARAQEAAAAHARQAMDGHQAHLSHWRRGIGISDDGGSLPELRRQAALPTRRAACVAAEIDTWSTLRG